MTRYEKSDAQLDAEAAAPLSELIRKHRIYYQRDLYIPRLAADEPPVFTNPQTGERRADDMSIIGPTLSWPLESYITASYGQTFPWSRAAFAQWATCRRTHSEHWDREEFRGSLCRQLVGLVIRQAYHLDRACLTLGTTPERSAKVLRSALIGIDSEMQRQHEKATQRAKEDAGQFVGQDQQGHYVWDAPPPLHHAVPGMHEHDCPNPACVQKRAA